MEPLTPDWYTVVGFWLSLALGGVGLGLTYRQARQARYAADAAKSAADAALEAAEQTRRENRAGYRKFIAAVGHRYVSEVEAALNARAWAVVVFRCDDLATVAAQLGDDRAADGFRGFVNHFRTKTDGKNCQYDRAKWADLLLDTKRSIGRLIAPIDNGGKT